VPERGRPNHDGLPPMSCSARTPIALLALPALDATVLEMAIERLLGDQLCIVAQEDAEIALIDGDSAMAQIAMAEWRRLRPFAPTLVLSLHPGPDTELLKHLRRPLDVAKLVEALKALRAAARRTTGLRHEPGRRLSLVPPNPGFAAAETETRDYFGLAEDLPADLLRDATTSADYSGGTLQLYFDPEVQLLGLLRRAGDLARKGGRPVQINGLQGRLAVLPDEPLRVCSSLSETALRELCCGAMFSETLVVVQTHAVSPQDYCSDFDELLWKLALWTSRGRLPRGTDPAAAVRLRRAPDFPRFLVTPHAASICRLWLEKAVGLVESAACLRVPQRYVFALYCACLMLELLEPAASR
jgi:hypothetical protein